MPIRVVRFMTTFFDALDELLPESRAADGTPSATDFLLYDLPALRDLLATNYEGSTVVTPGAAGVRVYIGHGALVGYFALFAVIALDEAIEVWNITIDAG